MPMASQPKHPRMSGRHERESQSTTGEAVARHSQAAAEHFLTTPAKDVFGQLKQYAREKPDVAACWCFAVGIVVGWKLRG
ncbi:hypothetical protein [Rubripirellula reticaptiva]|uniref:Uncharacterized protein n=1 Tax=Rubripirellula reticaptiva TaxID=2528013 RepID=A0A5C6EEW2_9BACT|nr:hypothetical protein [Rubripirellula reticaptiva]TWU46537.1 hypothetical protein Poly59_55100 [Rubripirellula reticaptiva]